MLHNITQSSSISDVVLCVRIEHRSQTFKVNKDDEVIVLEVITSPEVKVFHKVPPAPRSTSVAFTGGVICPHLGGVIPKQLSI